MAYVDRFAGLGKTLKKMLLTGLVIAVPFAGYHILRPQVDLKMSGVRTSESNGSLTLNYFALENRSYIPIKDFEIACDMKGPSGTTISTGKKLLFDVLEAGGVRTYTDLSIGPTPEQATKFDCYVSSASVDW